MANINQQLIDETNKYNGQVRKNLNSLANELIESANGASSVLTAVQGPTSQGGNSIDALIDGSKLDIYIVS